MIKKICFVLIAVSLFIAIPLALVGIKKVELGPSFIGFMNQVSEDLKGWEIKIPDIPKIPVYENADGFQLILNVMIKLVNVITSIINIVSSVLNIVIQVLQFICTLIWDLRYLVENMKATGDTSYHWPIV